MEHKYGGMTVNERLWVSGLMNKFEEAINCKDTQKAIEILKAVELTGDNIKNLLISYNLPL